MRTYLWRTLFQNIISKLAIGIATSIFGFALIMFWKRALHIYAYIHMWKALCQNIIFELSIGITSSFLECRLTSFGKELFNIWCVVYLESMRKSKNAQSRKLKLHSLMAMNFSFFSDINIKLVWFWKVYASSVYAVLKCKTITASHN